MKRQPSRLSWVTLPKKNRQSWGDPTKQESAELGDPTKEESAELGDPTKQESAELGDPTKEESAELGDPTKQESAELGDPAKQESAELGDPTKQESAELGTSSNSDLKATAMANTQSSIITSNGGGPSPAAIAGIVVAGVVAVAVVAVFISYRKNQQRQRDIMQDGVIVYADNNSFSPVDEAIWLDRLNYFRTTGLPWSAANMQRIGWKNDLAKTAASSAAKCSATTGPGVNVYQSSSLSSTSLSIIDEAIQEWVVETSMKTLRTLAQPANMQTVLVEAARRIANGEKPPTVPPAATTATPTSSSLKTPSKTPSTPSSSKTHSVSSNEDVGDTKKSATEKTPSSSKTHSVSSNEDVDDTKKSATEKTPSSSKTHSVSSDEDVGDTKKSATEKTPSSSKTHSVSSDEDVGDTKTSAMDETPSPSTKTGKESTSTSKKPDKTSTHSSMETSTEQEEDLVPGTVKASSDKGSTFTNEKPSTKNPTSSSPTSTSSKPDNDESLPPTTPMSGSSPAPSTMTVTQHKGVESNISVAGITGISVLVIVCIAAFGVVMSYKRNQRRQREIMRDGGIRVD
ncbi:unnamed protein product [Peronospora farinosa]|uniref:Mid2 domain-containing protein n=1 Tax=Peronospora farinosa TaxID=134698 RepID=A0AAV0TD18_9STRA|nr:unnamed protein product [Peronospora farinosa]